MPATLNRKLKVFLCHSSDDKPAVRDLYNRLKSEGWIDPWLDEEKLYPGQDWDREIEIAVEESESVVILLSKESVEKESYVQYELRSILHIAKYKPAGVIFVLPLRINKCEVPRSLKMWQHIDYFPENRKDWAYQRILGSLKMRAAKLGIDFESILAEKKRAEQEKSKEERRKKIAAEKAREDKERIERREKEKIKQEALEKARKEQETLEKKEAEEKARKIAAEKARKEKEKLEKEIAIEKTRQKTPIRLRNESAESPSPAFGRGARGEGKSPQPKPSSKPKNLPYFIGGGILILFFIIYLIGKATDSPTIPAPTATKMPAMATEKLPTEIAATATKKPSTEVSATYTQISTKTPVPTPTLGIGSTVISPKDGMILLYVPAGEFEMGSEDWENDEKPVHTVFLDAFWIDQTEVTEAMYARCVDFDICDSPIDRGGVFPHNGEEKYDNHPVIYVSWEQAFSYCSWVGRRLPTEAEWEKAARGINSRVYPWGDYVSMNHANYNAQYQQGGSTTITVASYEMGKSFYGAYDMAGNVWEWVADWYDEDYYADSPVSNPFGPEAGTQRVRRGGSLFSEYGYEVRSSIRASTTVDYGFSHVGFRCARSP